MFSYLISWFDSKPMARLEENWEYVFSVEEEQDLAASQHRTQLLQQEITTMDTGQSLVKARSRFSYIARQEFLRLTPDLQTKLQHSRLDASVRNRLIRDLIRDHTTTWLDLFLASPTLLSADHLVASWKTEKYNKNIIGEMCDLAFQASNASHTKGFTATVAGDIIWSIYVSLIKSLEDHLVPDPRLLLELVGQLVAPLIQLWVSTVEILRTMAEREGKLVAQWHQEDQRRREKLIQLKQEGVTAKYEVVTYSPLITETLIAPREARQILQNFFQRQN